MDRQAGSCWLSMKPWVMASFGSKSPTSLYTTTWAFDVYRPSPPTRSAITANASGTFGSGTCDQPVGIGSTMLSALKSRLTCGSQPDALVLEEVGQRHRRGGDQRLRTRRSGSTGAAAGMAGLHRRAVSPARLPACPPVSARSEPRPASPSPSASPWTGLATAVAGRRVRRWRCCPRSRLRRPSRQPHLLPEPASGGRSRS